MSNSIHPDQDGYFDSIINSLGENRENYFNAIAPPVIQTSNFAFETVEALKKAFDNEYENLVYSRGRNPTTDMLRQKLAALDGAEDCLVFNCGAAAIFAAVFSNVKSGDHIISIVKPYSWAQNIFDKILTRFDVTTTYVDGKSIDDFKQAYAKNTKIIYLETPNSWDFGIQDLKEIASWARQKDIITICDNSYCTPIYQQPIRLGIDITIQSATKYIGGHSDTLGGVLSGSHKMLNGIFNNEFLSIGSGMSPFNAWLMLRGLRTLPLRLQHSSNSAQVIISLLKAHPKVEEVHYPFDQDFEQYELAKTQMTGAGGLFTIVLKAKSYSEVTTFCESLKYFLIAVSWGGHESLVLPKCASLDPARFSIEDIEYRKIRFYVGLERTETLAHDIAQALEKYDV